MARRTYKYEDLQPVFEQLLQDKESDELEFKTAAGTCRPYGECDAERLQVSQQDGVLQSGYYAYLSQAVLPRR